MNPSIQARQPKARPFNTPLECGLRLLFLCNAANGSAADLQRLISYDYLLVHSGDVPEGPISLHPAVPFRNAELLVRRAVVREGLNLMFSRELITKEFTSGGIFYYSNALTGAFLDLLHSQYATGLKDRAAWIIGKFHGLSDAALSSFMAERFGRWGTEFDQIVPSQDLEL